MKPQISLSVMGALVLSLVLTACQPKTGAGAGPSGTSSQTGGGAPAPKYDGTVSGGGGGNGIDGRMLESYSVSISTLPEYRRYVGPVLRRMSRGRPDILLSYLQWAVKHKVWYFIPRPLPELPKEQTALAFSSDQLALHTERAVYIHSPTYDKRTLKEKAELLMHEMVMGARFLMKKTPKEQCEALRDGDLKECSSKELMELAQVTTLSDEERKILNGADHDAVRALTLYLLKPDQDLSGATIAVERKKLGYEFPWDQAISDLTIEDVAFAFHRGQLAGDRLVTPDKSLIADATVERDCVVTIDMQGGGHMLAVVKEMMTDEEEPKWGSKHEGDKAIVWRNGSDVLRTVRHFSYIYSSLSEGVEARGILDPRGTKEVVDLIRISPDANEIGTVGYSTQIVEFYLAREEKPRLIEIRIITATIMKGPGGFELVINKKNPPIRCTLAP